MDGEKTERRDSDFGLRWASRVVVIVLIAMVFVDIQTGSYARGTFDLLLLLGGPHWAKALRYWWNGWGSRDR